MTELLLEASGIAKHYGAVAALRSASLAVRPGEVHALMGAQRRRQEHPGQDPHRGGRARRRHGRHRRPAVHRSFARRGTRRRGRVGLPGAVAHPGPRHRLQPASDADIRRAVSTLAGRARDLQPVPDRIRPRPAARHAARHRPRASAVHRAACPAARRDDRRAARGPDRASPGGDRQPARLRSLHHLHLASPDRDRRGLRPRDRPPRRRDRRCRRCHRGSRGSDRRVDARRERGPAASRRRRKNRRRGTGRDTTTARGSWPAGRNATEGRLVRAAHR